jgi:hypothetical protein
MAKSPRKRLSLPRAPLPQQRGGVHPDRTKAAVRKRKHKKPVGSGEPED